jgi:DNA modification methylase
MRKLPADSVDMCVTSPPYWGLRDYGVAGQMGLEPTLGEHLDVMVAVFEEVRRVLKPHGSLWLNYGDCYATAPNGRSAADTKAEGVDDRTFRDKPFSTVGPVYGAKPGQPNEAANGTGRRGGGNAPAGAVYVAESSVGGYRGGDRNTNNPAGRVVAGGFLKPKDLCMIPNRLAIALQDAGWWVRSEIVWGKPNAMPDSSGAYRPSVAHEKIWLLTKSGDADIWRARDSGALSFDPDLTERCPLVTKPDEDGPRWAKLGSYYDAGAVAMRRATSDDGKAPDSWDTGAGGHGTIHRSGREKGAKIDKQRGHSRRHAGFNDRWDGMTRAEQTANGRLLRSYERDLSAIVPPEVWDIATASFRDAHFATFPPALVAPCIMAGCPKGGTVLDPFGGAGTTGLVADRLGRDAILIELNPDYAEMARERLRARFVAVTSTLPTSARLHGPLFDEVAA